MRLSVEIKDGGSEIEPPNRKKRTACESKRAERGSSLIKIKSGPFKIKTDPKRQGESSELKSEKKGRVPLRVLLCNVKDR
jgi:hypothetical protein